MNQDVVELIAFALLVVSYTLIILATRSR